MAKNFGIEGTNYVTTALAWAFPVFYAYIWWQYGWIVGIATAFITTVLRKKATEKILGATALIMPEADWERKSKQVSM